MKILMVVDEFSLDAVSGCHRVVDELSKALIKNGHRLYLLTRCLGRGQGSTEIINGIRVYRYSLNRSNSIVFFISSLINSRRLLRRIFKKEHFDLINLHSPLSALGVIFSQECRRTPKVYTFHSSWPMEYQVKTGKEGLGFWLRKHIERMALKAAGKIIVLSEFSKKQVLGMHNGISLKKIEVIAGGIDTVRFHPAEDKKDLRGRLGIAQEKFVLFTLRNLVPRMGLENLIRAMSIIVRKNPKVFLIVGGDGFLRDRLKQEVMRFSLEGYVKFSGAIPEKELALYYQAADLFILPTKALEGFGLVTLEALSSALPVLATPVGATEEILGQTGHDFLFKDSSPGSMAEKILRYSSKSDLGILGKRCRDFAIKHYSWEKAALAYQRAYSSAFSVKVLHLHTLPVVSGSGIYVLMTMRWLKDKGYEVEFASAPGGRLIKEVERNGIVFYPIRHFRQEINPFYDLAAFIELFLLIKRRRYTIVHTHNSKAGFLGRIAAKISGTPVIVHTIHGFSFHSCEIPLRRRVFMILERFAANFTDKLISVSVPMKNWGLSLGIGRTKQYCVIPSGIEIEKFDINLDLSGLRKEFGFGADDLVVGAVAKLWKGKGHSTIIKSAPLVIQEVPKVKFIFIGEGYLRRNLEKDIAKRKLSGYFQFAGFRSDIPQVTGLLDVALLVSSFEGLGRVILEAMASRKPVVASNVGGITDIVQDGINGFLVQPNHPETLARVLIKLLKDSALRRRLGENGRRKVEEGFRAERTLNDTETIYQELLREKKIR